MDSEYKNFIDALVDRNYVIMVQWYYIDMDSFVGITKHEQISPKGEYYTIKELYDEFPTNRLRNLVQPYLSDSECQRVRTYIAHKNNLMVQWIN